MSDPGCERGRPKPPLTLLLRWGVLVTIAAAFLLQIARGECPVY